SSDVCSSDLEVPTEVPTEAPADVPVDQPDTGTDDLGGLPAIGELLYDEDLSTWPEVTYDFGHGYVHEGAYYIYNTSSVGDGIYLRTGLLDISDHFASI